MNKHDYMKNVDKMKDDGKRTNLISCVVVFPFISLVLFTIVATILQQIKISAIIGVIAGAIISVILYIITCRQSDKNVMDIYAKEIPVECKSCGGSFTVIAGNEEECPFCGHSVLVNNQGKIISRE